jgi:WD repeat-containing protein 35
VFWDTHSDERHTKQVKRLAAIRAAGENAVLATRSDHKAVQLTVTQPPSRAGGAPREREVVLRQHNLILCNAIGSPVDSKELSLEPVHLAMTPTHVVVADDKSVYVWTTRAARSSSRTRRPRLAARR